MPNKLCLLCLAFFAIGCFQSFSQHAGHHQSAETDTAIEAQPLLAQATRLAEALTFLGSSLSKADQQRLKQLQHAKPGPTVTKIVQQILDPYCLAMININPESRVKVTRGEAIAKLIQGGWVSYLVKVNNDAGITAQLQVESPNAAPPLYASSFESVVPDSRKLTAGQVASRFLEMQVYRNPPLLPNLSGLKIEYAVVQIYCKDAGKREATIGFNVGQGTQDIGFRNGISILFNSSPAVRVNLHIEDDDGSPTMASFVFTDGIERVLDDSIITLLNGDMRLVAAQREYQTRNKQAPASLTGIYPLPSRRVADYDEYPDFFFQPQVYRADGEHIDLPPGKYQVVFTRGPEYLAQSRLLTIPANVRTYDLSFKLKRWVNLARLGWYSADHHVHAAGCSHYESPEEGVKPKDMWRQALGEDLNVAALLAWGPGWYYQKKFFTGKDDTNSTASNIMRNDVEVSGFPSSHAGHVVLLRLKEDDYPNTKRIEDWPSWTLPVMDWARKQGAKVGYAHSGWGLEPSQPTTQLPNYVVPKMDGIGANEFIVTVTQGLVDFYSAGDTPAPWELNMWYHSLNCGFTPKLSGETDFPCIFDERVGLARSYFKSAGKLSYEEYVSAISKGSNYVSEGNSHIIDYSVNNVEPGDNRLMIQGKQEVNIKAKVTALLPETQDAGGASIARSPFPHQPYWHIERARLKQSRRVAVELIVNGHPVDTTEITADGGWNDVSFSYPIDRSSWMALRVYPSSHTNPVFVIMDGKPIREGKSAAWCRQAVDQCWKMKQSNIREEERAAARAAYDKARDIYQLIEQEASGN